MKILPVIILIFFLPVTLLISQDAEEIQFPVPAEIFVGDKFNGSEGIAFNGEGRMFVTASNGFWEVDPKGNVTRLADLYSNLGVAAISQRDLLVADFGPTNAFSQQRNHDGIVWRITPEGQKIDSIKGIGDPNFILVKKAGSYLVSDDATNEIFQVDTNGNVELFLTAVNHPNGLAFSPDESTLYVAQIFKNIRPVIFDNRVWLVKLVKGKPYKDARLLFSTGPGGANDGLAVDKHGNVYVAANKEGKIWRFNPENEELTLISENMDAVASLAFGEGDFDHQAIYAITTLRGGSKIYKVNVGVEGLRLNR